MQKLLLRGASFRHLDVRTGDSKAFVRAHISTDITPAIAEHFGWDIYKNDHLINGLIGSTKLDGDLFLKELGFEVNGIKSDPLEIVATTAEDFQLTRKKSETGDGVETNLRFILTTMAVVELVQFFCLMGTADGALTLELAAETNQATLDEQPHMQKPEPAAEPDPEPEPAKGKSKHGSLAPKLVMEKIQ
jgi:hypothetical protein